SKDVEEQAVDIHLFERSVSASHPSIAGAVMESLRSGYESVVGSSRLRMLMKRVSEIRARARYVERGAY
ncbi:MAG: Kae1-associated kinase Bud32, partial [Nitrososphaerota archaeon]